MAERAKKGLSAEARLRGLERDRARAHRERLLRELAGPRWRRMVDLTPVLFDREGSIVARVLRADRDAIIEALVPDAVFALDTAMRIGRGYGFLSGGDIHVYLTSERPIDELVAIGMLESGPADSVLVRPWQRPARLIACIVEALPPSREVGRARVVTDERLGRELVGAVGRRADLFALLDRRA